MTKLGKIIRKLSSLSSQTNSANVKVLSSLKNCRTFLFLKSQTLMIFLQAILTIAALNYFLKNPGLVFLKRRARKKWRKKLRILLRIKTYILLAKMRIYQGMGNKILVKIQSRCRLRIRVALAQQLKMKSLSLSATFNQRNNTKLFAAAATKREIMQ